jgi:hypothetical protein
MEDNAYTIAFGGLLLLGGLLSDLLGAGKVFVAGWGVLIAGSVVAAAAHSAWVKVAGRAAQGVGGALIAPASMTLLMMLFGPQPQGTGQGPGPVRRGRSGRRHRRRLPRRGAHPVGQLAVGTHHLLAVGTRHLHPDRHRHPVRHRPAASRRRLPRRRGRRHRRRSRHRGLALTVFTVVPRPRSRLGNSADRPSADRMRRWVSAGSVVPSGQ